MANAPQVDVNTINHIFSEDERGISDILKRFVVDQYIDASIASGNAEIDTLGLPPKFVHAVLSGALRRLQPPSQTASSSDCKYHTHDVSRACYKLSVQPIIMRREEKLELAREESRKDSEEVTKNTESSGVIIADWEERAAEAKRALMEQHGCKRVGFRRLGEERPLETEAVRSIAAYPQKSHELPGASENVETEACTSCNVFGTALASGAIDDVLRTAPSRAPPPPPVLTELPTDVPRTKEDSDILPEYRTYAATLGHESTTSMSKVRNPNSRSSQSAPDSEFRHDIELVLKLEEHLKCPGAFPISRSGSTKSTVSIDV